MSSIKTENEPKMREQKSKSLRLLQIENYIKTMNYPNIPRLMKETERSRRTILRDIEALKNDYNAPIEYDPVHKGYYYTDETFFVKNVMISESEFVAIASLLPLLERYKNTPLEQQIQKVYKTISQMLPNQIEVQTAITSNVEFISDPVPAVEEDVFNQVFTAIKNNLIMDFDYRSLGATKHKPHTAWPYKVYNQKGDWYVVAYYPKREKYTTFTLARMKNIVLSEKHFERDPDYEKKVHIDPNIGIWNNEHPPETIELVFDKSINTYILERTWHKDQVCRQMEDGSVYLSFSSNQSQEILYWILKFGSKVKVLSPESLRQNVIEEHKKAAAIYD